VNNGKEEEEEGGGRLTCDGDGMAGVKGSVVQTMAKAGRKKEKKICRGRKSGGNGGSWWPNDLLRWG